MPETMTYADLFRIEFDRMHKNEKAFIHHFGVSLKKYWNPITGFDIVGFDRNVIKTPDNVSMSDYIVNKFCKDAEQVIANMIEPILPLEDEEKTDE